MPEIKIPKELEEKLPHGSFVYNLMENVEAIPLKIPYFPEYTLHNALHINAVLELAVQIIPPATLKKLDERSVEILIGAIILHDMGMFIECAGLNRLIFGEHKDRQVTYLDKLTWHEAWLDFYRKARRYTDHQLIRLFGNASPVGNLPPDEIPEGHNLLYGEFLRQNHGRLAFDITQISFPCNDVDFDVFKNCSCDEITKTMIGLVARSHDMKLRNTENFLEKYKFEPPKTVYYLMVVLRIADYLHLGEKRAPELLMLKNNINSPESIRQFHINQSIVGEPIFDLEKKLVYVNANPDCSSTYEDIEQLFHQIQQELDYSWAFLAEKSAYEYELSIHRVMSNLFDEDKAAAFNKVFLTQGVAIGANPDIVKLLIEPLYSNEPTYGVRELIQNAVDACNERTALDTNFAGKITVSVDTGKRTVEITDNGIGMNDDVLKNYFLIAGSSYRYSDEWRGKHTDDEGKATIVRSGRFGIGALASFLIGDEITVTTRHLDDELGFQFTYTMEPKTLNVTRVDAVIGTTIKIKMSEDSYEYFTDSDYLDSGWGGYRANAIPLWHNWYHFNTPEIFYYLDGNEIGKERFIVPDKGIEKNGWYDVNSTVFLNIKLNFHCNDFIDFFNDHDDDDDVIENRSVILVNGILVDDNLVSDSSEWNNKYGLSVAPLAISLVDSDSIVNIDISRNRIFEIPEEALVVEEACKYDFARLLVTPMTDAVEIAVSDLSLYHGFAVSDRGFTLCEPSFIYHTKQKKIICLYGEPIAIPNPELILKTPIALSHYSENPFVDSTSDYLLRQIERNIISQECLNFWYDFSDLDKKTLSKTPFFKDPRHNKSQPPYGLQLSEKLPLIIEYAPKNPCKTEEENIMLKLLREYIPVEVNDGWIPFDMEKRKELYTTAFTELARYMRH
jgi:hypothetical protein